MIFSRISLVLTVKEPIRFIFELITPAYNILKLPDYIFRD